MASFGDFLTKTVVEPTIAANTKYGNYIWYQQYSAGWNDPNYIRANWDRWRSSPGYDSQAEQMIQAQVDWWESRSGKREIFGVIPVSRKDYEAIGQVGATLGGVGLAAGAVYAGGIATGLIGTGEAVATGTAAAETAAVSGGASGSVAAATSGGGSGIFGGITAAGINSGIGLLNTATNLLRRVGINIGGSSTESRPSAASGGTGNSSLYPYYLEGTGPSIGSGFGFGGPEQGPSETITDFVRAATGGGVWLIVAAVLLIGGYFLLKRR